MGVVFLGRQVIVAEDLSLPIRPVHIQVRLLARINRLGRIVVALELAALDVLDPSVVDDVGHRNALIRVRMQHV